MKIIHDKFVNKIFGDEIEYIVINNNNEKRLIFQYGTKIHIINIDTIKKIAENLIESKLLSEFLKETIEEQDSYISDLESELGLDIDEETEE